jgi:hypothetical protein
MSTLTPQLLIAASTLLRLAHPTDASLSRALDKAGERLMCLPWRMCFEHMEITSASHPNEVHLTDGEVCTCKTTRGVCWHRAAYYIVSTIGAAGVQLQPPLPLPDMDALQAYDAYDEYGDFLQDLPTPTDRWQRVQSAADALFS